MASPAAAWKADRTATAVRFLLVLVGLTTLFVSVQIAVMRTVNWSLDLILVALAIAVSWRRRRRSANFLS